jgi:glycosyltransferase involved in cell wall biosynthesis
MRGKLRIFEVYPGPYKAMINAHIRKKRRQANYREQGKRESSSSRTNSTLNWKGRLEAFLFRMSKYWIYPDLRRESLPFLVADVKKRLNQEVYKAVVFSHEPPLSLEAMLKVRPHIIAAQVIADLGDPVLIGYTPKHWRGRAFKLERSTCSAADAIVVTSWATRALLQARHPESGSKLHVITQGFDCRADHATATVVSTSIPGCLKLVYTGRLYRFRDPGIFLSSIAQLGFAHLFMALPEVPDWLDVELARNPNVTQVGRLSHKDALTLQQDADVLVVFGNEDATQTPGKLYEYLGLQKPILYVYQDASDEGAALVIRLNRGLTVANSSADICVALEQLQRWKCEGGFPKQFDLSKDTVNHYTWSALAKQYGVLLSMLSQRIT